MTDVPHSTCIEGGNEETKSMFGNGRVLGIPRWLIGLVALYAIASLIHFIHNAERLADYPNLPATWTREGVYLAWLGMTALGAIGLTLLARGLRILGFLVIAGYAVLGLDSLGHYVVAPFSAHTAMMNVTILLEVGCAALVLVAALVLLVRIFVDRRAASAALNEKEV